MQWKEDTTAGSSMSTGRSAYGIRTTTKLTYSAEPKKPKKSEFRFFSFLKNQMSDLSF